MTHNWSVLVLKPHQRLPHCFKYWMVRGTDSSVFFHNPTKIIEQGSHDRLTDMSNKPPR